MPLAVHAAMSAFEAKKGQLVNMEVGRIREATQTLNGYVICILVVILVNFIFWPIYECYSHSYACGSCVTTSSTPLGMPQLPHT